MEDTKMSTEGPESLLWEDDSQGGQGPHPQPLTQLRHIRLLSTNLLEGKTLLPKYMT